jgi:prolyl 4-hydroxylase
MPHVKFVLFVLFVVVIVAFLTYYIIKRNQSGSKPQSTMQYRHVLGDDHGAIRFEKNGYIVYEYPNLLTSEECDSLIAYSQQKGMTASDVLDYASTSGTVVNNDYRTSKTAWIQDSEHHVCAKMAALSEKLTGLPKCNQEMAQVAHYESGGKFNEHYDACSYDDQEYCNRMNNNAGQRRSTLLVYLNDDFQGGETEFVAIGYTVTPEKGKAILFWNTDENEVIIPESKHRAHPVRNGEKWICTKWSHSRNYPT